jgi:hypothetical protein
VKTQGKYRNGLHKEQKTNHSFQKETKAMKPKTLFLLVLVGVTFALSACLEKTAPMNPKPTINSFTASPPSLPERGGEITLNWNVEDAATLVIAPMVGEVTGSSRTVSIMNTTTFTLTASNGAEQTSKSLTVNVAGSAADTTAPTVVSSTPTKGATGITKDSSIVIAFSEKMDQLSTQAAYQSADLPGVAVTFSWNAEGTELTITPNKPLSYVTGTNPTIAAKTYAFSITSTATDLAGNALTPFSSSFSTLKAITTSFTGEADRDGTVTNSGFVSTSDTTFLVGDGAANQALRGFLSFDLTFIFGDAVTIERATLSFYKTGFRGSPYTALEDCTPSCTVVGAKTNLNHVSYGDTLTAEDFSTPSLGDLGGVDDRFKPVSGSLSAEVTSAVRDDFANRATRGNRSQYRLSFPITTNSDGVEDDVSFNTANSNTNQPKLEVVYLIP